MNIKVTDLSEQDLKHVLWKWHLGMCQSFGGETGHLKLSKYAPSENFNSECCVCDVNNKPFSYNSFVKWLENNKKLYLIENEIIHRPEVIYGITDIYAVPKDKFEFNPIVSVIDAETVATVPCAEIKSVSIVTGNVFTGEILHVLDIKVNSTNLNRTRDKKTLEFWQKQKKENPVAWHLANGPGNALSLKETLEQISDYFSFIKQTHGECALFGNGPDFDQVIMEDAFRQLKMPVPWAFWNNQSCRTGVWFEHALFGTRISRLRELYPVTHISLEDVKREFYILCSQVKALKEAVDNYLELKQAS